MPIYITKSYFKNVFKFSWRRVMSPWPGNSMMDYSILGFSPHLWRFKNDFKPFDSFGKTQQYFQYKSVFLCLWLSVQIICLFCLPKCIFQIYLIHFVMSFLFKFLQSIDRILILAYSSKSNILPFTQDSIFLIQNSKIFMCVHLLLARWTSLGPA